MTTILAVLILFIIFCNGYGCAEANAIEYDVPFFQKWNKYVEEAMYGKASRFAMKSLYFIPTTAAIFSWCRTKFCPAQEEDLY